MVMCLISHTPRHGTALADCELPKYLTLWTATVAPRLTLC